MKNERLGKWKVFSNFINEEKMYIVGRILDTSQPEHGGNIEYAPGFEYVDDKLYADAYAECLNLCHPTTPQEGDSIAD